MSILLDGTQGIDFNDGSNQSTAATPYARKNFIINGDMRIAQRGTSAITTDGFPVDRFIVVNGTDGAFSAQQDSSAPVEFINSTKFTTTTVDSSLASTQSIYLQHRIEGTNVANLGFGTANAKTITVSFWVRSSLTGTFGGSIINNGFDRSYPFSYSISLADTWEKKSITIAGDTTGTWLTTTGRGMILNFSLGAGADRVGTSGSWVGANNQGVTGQVQVIENLNATWYITGVQLEVGDSASDFEFVPYDMELARCQRYFQTCGQAATGRTYGASSIEIAVPFKVTMRANPTATFGGFSGSQAVASEYGVGNVTMSSLLGYSATVSGAYFNPAISGGTTGSIVGVINGDAFSMSAEL